MFLPRVLIFLIGFFIGGFLFYDLAKTKTENASRQKIECLQHAIDMQQRLHQDFNDSCLRQNRELVKQLENKTKETMELKADVDFYRHLLHEHDIIL